MNQKEKLLLSLIAGEELTEAPKKIEEKTRVQKKMERNKYGEKSN